MNPVPPPSTTDPSVKRRRLDAVALLPAAATLGNLLSGLLAMLCCLLAIRSAAQPAAATAAAAATSFYEFAPSYLAMAVWLIVLAMLFDALDGRLARIARRTSEFGSQLDSIADIVSFGAAPALMLITLLLIHATPGLWRIGLVAALIFVSCAAIRLARFNVENVRAESAQRRFSGLPTPGAGAALIAWISLHEHLAVASAGWAAGLASAVRWIAPLVATGLGVLMVSRLDYVHVFNIYVRRNQPPWHLLVLLAAVGLVLISPPALLAIAAFTYVFSGLALNLRRART